MKFNPCLKMKNKLFQNFPTVLLRGGLAIVAMRQLPRGFCDLPYKMSQKEAFEEF
jgi:hypothetical protein